MAKAQTTWIVATLLAFPLTAVRAEPKAPAQIAPAKAAPAEVAADKLKSARWWIDKASQYAKDVVDAEAQGDIYYHLAYVQARIGDLEKASASAALVSNPQKCVYAYTFVAKQHHKRGDAAGCAAVLDKVRAVAMKANEKPHQGHIDSHLIDAYFELGFPEQATTYVHALPDQLDRHMGYRHIATELAKAGKIDEAFQFVRANLPADVHDIAFGEMAEACASQIEESIRIVDRVGSAERKDRAYTKLIESLVQINRISEAEKLVERMVDLQARCEARALIASKSTKNKSIDDIKAEIAQAQSREEQLSLYKDLFARLLEAEKFDEAEAVIERMVVVIDQSPRPPVPSPFGQADDQFHKAIVKSQYLIVARALAKKGQRERAISRIALAAKPILALPDTAGIGKVMPQMNLMQTQMDLGDVDGAKKTIEAVSNKGMRAPMDAHLAQALIKTGDIPGAVRIGKQIAAAKLPGNHRGKGHQIGRLAEALIDAGHVPAAKEVLANLGNSQDEAEGYRDVGSAMIKTRQPLELYHWLGAMPSKMAAAYACLGAADGFQRK